ncbi:MAG TPA: DUF1552 domain-containing protein [Kofleriaceae bacterium]|jgi:hypothetical protein
MTISRRRFLAGTGGALGALALGPSIVARMARADDARAPTRLLIVHKPAGTVPETYDCAGIGRDFTLSPILEPFADLRDHMVVIDGLAVPKASNTPGEDHGNCIVTFMTGGVPFKPEGTGIAVAERISIDQILAGDPAFSGDVPVRSLQLTADDRALQFFMRILSYAGRGLPLAPEQDPTIAYARVFGTFSDGVLAPAQVAQALANKRSVLDFARGDLQRIRGQLGGDGRERLDRHLAAITEVEGVLHKVVGYDTAALHGELLRTDARKRDDQHAEIGRAHLDIVRAAFQCDLTRVAAFQWGSMELDVSRIIPGLLELGYHSLSHYAGAPDIDAQLTAIHRWYNAQLAGFLRTLRDTPDRDGRSLLDNTLVVVWSEIRRGNHTFDNLPIQLFGGAGGRLAGGRLLRYPNQTTNDLWLTIGNALGQDMTVFGDPERCTGALAGLFEAPVTPA